MNKKPVELIVLNRSVNHLPTDALQALEQLTRKAVNVMVVHVPSVHRDALETLKFSGVTIEPALTRKAKETFGDSGNLLLITGLEENQDIKLDVCDWVTVDMMSNFELQSKGQPLTLVDKDEE